MVPITHTVDLPIAIADRTVTHTFQVMLNLSGPVLIGIDFWAKLGVVLPAPPNTATSTQPAVGEISAGLTPRTSDEDCRLREFLHRELSTFETVRGPTDLIEHRIRLTTDQPIKQRYQPRNPAMQSVIDQEVRKIKDAGVIEPWQSAWSSPVVLVKNKDGTYRFCIDFRKLNEVTQKDAYPLPHIAATLDKLQGAR